MYYSLQRVVLSFFFMFIISYFIILFIIPFIILHFILDPANENYTEIGKVERIVSSSVVNLPNF